MLGVHLILSYFIWISLLTLKTFVLFGWWVVGGGWRTFFIFKSLDNNMVYSLGIDVFLCNRKLCRTKVLWVLNFGEVEGGAHLFQIHKM